MRLVCDVFVLGSFGSYRHAILVKINIERLARVAREPHIALPSNNTNLLVTYLR